ncbi:hypothetical protein Tsubulata_009515 [Turnera subulata]|uniref:Amine oxidase domain-containing protein n=1 Tax=Turnera subulata TaxID=218843 RepID=A0A9Q0FAZ2_9ROSI|nr:hypothetical protein Tsubulata_009515 [Turnera subulata]
MPFTAGISSLWLIVKEVLRRNTRTQARRNISDHFDLSNELFATFLDETMQYSCAVFKSDDEDLKTAQMRKISLLIEKARIDREHEVLVIGFGWGGGMATEIVKRTGCKYTSITISNEQLKLAEKKVKDAGLQDHIRFLFCDYRDLPETHKYDRILACEMLETIGDENMENFFRSCDSLLAQDGLLVIQCSVEHVENIGSSYYLCPLPFNKAFYNGKMHDMTFPFLFTREASRKMSCNKQLHPKKMMAAPSLLESSARRLAARFLRNYISSGCLTLVEEGGETLIFEGSSEKCSLNVVLVVHSPQFYWKVVTRADIGLAEAYIDGDFSLKDKDMGLVNLTTVLIASRDTNFSISKLNKSIYIYCNLIIILFLYVVNYRVWCWWSPMPFTAGISSLWLIVKEALRRNTLTQARRNISDHYDLSNELFATFLDETMQYSCAVFKSDDEDLKTAQMRKVSLLIEKARIDRKHEVLEIGFGWGAMAIEVVKRTGCKYTGITLSMEQLKLAEKRVKDAGLEDHIRFLLCDYRELPETHKYDRILSCEMIECTGDEYVEEFFRSCDSLLAEDGLIVIQTTVIPDYSYDEHRRQPSFIKEYIFPGGCLFSLSRITSAMASASRLCVEHVENIGSSYYNTLRCWRHNFLKNQRRIQDMGFDEKFIRKWEYYFDYCAAGFKSYVVSSYHIVFSRPGNTVALGNPYRGFPSAYC